MEEHINSKCTVYDKQGEVVANYMGVTVHETDTYIAVLDEEGYLFDAFGQDYTWSIIPQ